ncbi:MAG: hypothetical protein GDA43_12255 [Hormoscilla sp. SP5CHS1]|nr:hypothetical protein [Hormoscilla sp. SP5CHS1]
MIRLTDNLLMPCPYINAIANVRPSRRSPFKKISMRQNTRYLEVCYHHDKSKSCYTILSRLATIFKHYPISRLKPTLAISLWFEPEAG